MNSATKLRWRRETVILLDRCGMPYRVECECYGLLAISPHDENLFDGFAELWSVSHIPTGLSMALHPWSYRSARAIAKACAGLDWDFTDARKMPPGNYEFCKKIMAKYKVIE